MLKLMLNFPSKLKGTSRPSAYEVFFTEHSTVHHVRQFDDSAWAKLFFTRCREYYLEPAKKLGRDKHGFAAIVIISALIEYLVSMTTGKGRTTRSLIIRWIKDCLPDYEPVSKQVYELFRCGLVHNGRVKSGGLCSFDITDRWAMIHGAVVINPDELISAVECAINSMEKSLTKLERLRELALAMRSSHAEDVAQFA